MTMLAASVLAQVTEMDYRAPTRRNTKDATGRRHGPKAFAVHCHDQCLGLAGGLGIVVEHSGPMTSDLFMIISRPPRLGKVFEVNPLRCRARPAARGYNARLPALLPLCRSSPAPWMVLQPSRKTPAVPRNSRDNRRIANFPRISDLKFSFVPVNMRDITKI